MTLPANDIFDCCGINRQLAHGDRVRGMDGFEQRGQSSKGKYESPDLICDLTSSAFASMIFARPRQGQILLRSLANGIVTRPAVSRYPRALLFCSLLIFYLAAQSLRLHLLCECKVALLSANAFGNKVGPGVMTAKKARWAHFCFEFE